MWCWNCTVLAIFRKPNPQIQLLEKKLVRKLLSPHPGISNRKKVITGTVINNRITVPHAMSATYWLRINANCWAPNDLFSWKKKNNSYKRTLRVTFLYYVTLETTNLTLLAADPPSLRLEWVLLCFSHGFPISAGSQLTLFTRTGQAGPFFPPFLQTGSGKIWIQATAHFPVGHNNSSCKNNVLSQFLWEKG
jgi:hypothetical protein